MAKRASRKELSHKEHEEHKDCKGRIHAVNQSTFHHFPLVIFVLFVANLFSSRSVSICNTSLSFFGSGQRPDWVIRGQISCRSRLSWFNPFSFFSSPIFPPPDSFDVVTAITAPFSFLCVFAPLRDNFLFRFFLNPTQ